MPLLTLTVRLILFNDRIRSGIPSPFEAVSVKLRDRSLSLVKVAIGLLISAKARVTSVFASETALPQNNNVKLLRRKQHLCQARALLKNHRKTINFAANMAKTSCTLQVRQPGRSQTTMIVILTAGSILSGARRRKPRARPCLNTRTWGAMCLVFPQYTTGITDLSNSRALSSVDITQTTAIKTHTRLPRQGLTTHRIPPLSRVVATPPLVRTSPQTRRAGLLEHPSSSPILHQLARPPRLAPRSLIITII